MASPAAALQILIDANARPATRQINKAQSELNGFARKARTQSNVKLDADGRPLNRELNKSQRHMRTFSSASVSSTGRVRAGFGLIGRAASTAAPLIGAAGLGLAIKTMASEAREANKVGRDTDAVLKSTGGAAKVTKKHIEDLADSLSAKIGVDDEEIQKSENMLATFTRVRDETGKGNKVFSQAVPLIADMAARMDMGLKPATIMVGKALQDPVRGLTQLRRLGVNFTSAQQEMIKGWVASGQTLKAQKFILGELGTEFGGAAAAASDPMDRLKVSVNNLAEKAGLALAPATAKVVGALATFTAQMSSGEGAGGRFASVLGRIATTVWGIVKPIGLAVFQVGKFIGQSKLLTTIVGGLVGAILVYEAANWAAGKAQAFWTGVTKAWAAATKVAAAAQWLFNAAMAASPMGLVIVGLLALGTAMVVAYTKIGWFRDIVDGAWKVLRTATQATVGFIAGHWKLLGTILVGVFTGGIGLAVIALIKNWDKVRAATSALVGFLGTVWRSGPIQAMVAAARAATGAVVAAFRWLARAASATFGWIFNAARNVANFLMPVFRPLLLLWQTGFKVAMWAISTAVRVGMGVLVPIIRTAMTVILAIMRPAWAVVRWIVRTTADAVISNARRLAGVAAAVFRVFLGVVKVVWGAIKAAVIRPVGALVGWSIRKLHWFGGVIRGIWGAIRGAAAKGWAAIKSAVLRPVGSVIRTAANALWGFKRTLGGVWNAIKRGAGDAWGKIRDKITHPISQAVTTVKKLINAIISAINWLPIGKKIKKLQIGPTAQQRNDRNYIAGHARGGMIRKPMAIVGEEAPRHPEIVIATNPRYRSRNQKLAAQAASAVGLPGYAKGGQLGTDPSAPEGGRLYPRGQRVLAGIMPGLKRGGTILSTLIREANKIDARHYPYRWGGGHDPNFTPPYDCSGAVSAILHAAGLLSSPRVSGALAGFGGARGRGAATIYANPSHVFMSLAGRGWGTSNTNPGGGAGWLPYNTRGGFTVSHIANAGSAMGQVPGGGGGGWLPKIGGLLGKIGGLPEALVGGASRLMSQLIRKGLSKLTGHLPGWMQGLDKWVINRVANTIPGMIHLGGGGIPKGPWNTDKLAQLWRSVGGPGSVAHLMGAIAMAESGGDPHAHNPSGASGLWQILGQPFPGNVFDPKTNARMAVWKYKHQGLGAWEAYTRGMHRKYLAEGGVLGNESALAKGGAIGGDALAELAQGGALGKAKPASGFPPPNNLVLLRRGVNLAKHTGVPPVSPRMIKKFSSDAARAGEMADLATNDAGQRMWSLRRLKAMMSERNWIVRAVKEAAFRKAMMDRMLASYHGRFREISHKRHPTHMEAAVRRALPAAMTTVKGRRNALNKERLGYWDQLNKLQGAPHKARFARETSLPDLGTIGGSMYLAERQFYDLDPTRLVERSLGAGEKIAIGDFMRRLPLLASGTPYVKQDMVAGLHRGEAVVPAALNPYGSGGGGSRPTVQVNLNGSVAKFAEDVEVLIDGKKTDIAEHTLRYGGRKAGIARQVVSAPGRLGR